MREFKFRAWDKGNSLMCEVEQITFDENREITFLAVWNEEYGLQEAEPITHFELMQYTGLRDKDGKEIYEGDIVRSNYGNLVKVVFTKGSFKIASLVSPNRNLCLLEYPQFVKVIGNIYENPELLEV